MIRKSNLLVFVLGAGASVPAGLPAMASFMNRAKRRSETAHDSMRESYEVMFDFWLRCRGSSWALQRHWDNIEELYTQADLLRLSGFEILLGSRLYDGERLCRHISWCIWDIYRQFAGGLRPWSRIAEQVAKNDLRLAVITTNYDVVVEASLNVDDSQYQPFYPGFALNSPDHILTEDGTHWSDVLRSDDGAKGKKYVPVVKLHGSVNWFQNSINTDWSAYSDLVGVALHGGDPSGLVADRSAVIDALARRDEQWRSGYPAIIPPMLGKANLSRVIQNNWLSAIELLTHARQVWVIGYSFPTTDAFMLRLLTEGLYDNHDLDRFVILDKQSREDWQPRLSSMLDPIFARHQFSFGSDDSARVFDVMAGNPAQHWLSESCGFFRY